jgi:hypothetical protein
MENGMTHKILLKFEQNTAADEVLDQIVRARLKQIQEGLAAWDSERDIQEACLALLDWMGKPNAED